MAMPAPQLHVEDEEEQEGDEDQAGAGGEKSLHHQLVVGNHFLLFLGEFPGRAEKMIRV